MKMIRVRYKGPTDSQGSRLIADAPHFGRLTRSLNSIEIELEENGKNNNFVYCARRLAEEYIDKKWTNLTSKDAILFHGWHSKHEDFFLVMHSKDILHMCKEEDLKE